MILKVDAKALEWRVKVFLSQDKVALDEIHNGIDMHDESRKRFNLPSRLIAKKCNFRMIFADAYSEMGFSRPAYAYAKDFEFQHVSSSIKFWEGVCRAFFEKYSGMYQHGWNLIDEVYRTGRILSPSGRIYEFYHKTNKRGEPELPRTLILNYIVQGLSAEIMALARIALKRRLVRKGFDLDNLVLLINTVHDDIEIDVDNRPELIYNVCVELEAVFKDLPALFERAFGVPFNVPLSGEVSYGHNLGNLVEFKRENKIII